MALRAQSQRPSDRPDDWLVLSHAASLTGLSERAWRERAKALADRGLAKLAPPPGGRGRPTWWIHRKAHAELVRREATLDVQRDALCTKFGLPATELAYKRMRWLTAWQRACEEPGAASRNAVGARIVAKARRVEGEGFAISVRSLQAWRTAQRRGGLEALIDGRSIDRRADPEGGSSAARSPEAVAYFYGLYHTEQRKGVAACHEATAAVSELKGWAWPASYSATRQWLGRYDDLAMTCLMREGKEAYCHRFNRYMEVDWSGVEPGKFYVTDHTQCDFWVEYKGEQLRPWLTAVMDRRSRCVVGWHLGISPHQDAILAAFLMAFRDWAVPAVMHIDNGKDFASKLLTGVTKDQRAELIRRYGGEWKEHLVECSDPRFTGVLNELGIDVIYARPYAPWAKGTVERWYLMCHERFDKDQATYCGNSPVTRPESLEDVRAGRIRRPREAGAKAPALGVIDGRVVPTLEEAREVIAAFVTWHHHRPHKGEGMDGRSPLAVWHTATALRKADPAALMMLMQSRGVYKVGPNGVGLKIGGATVRYGRDALLLQRKRAREVLILQDPADVSRCFALEPESRRFICELLANERIPAMATNDEVREAHARMNRDRRIQDRAARQSAWRSRNVAEEMRSLRAQQKAPAALGPESAPTIVPVVTGLEGVAEQIADQAARVGRERAASDEASMDCAALFAPPPVELRADGVPSFREHLYGQRLTDADLDFTAFYTPPAAGDGEDEDTDGPSGMDAPSRRRETA